MRSYGILLILALVLISIAVVVRTGWLRRANPGEPANKYSRAQIEEQRFNERELAIIRRDYADAVVTPSGLRYLVLAPGHGEPPSQGAEVTAHYAGKLLDGGKQFDSSYDRHEPFRFRVGTGRVIKGWDEAFAAMRVGEKRRLVIPWWLAYGASGRGPIPPKATLVFDVELLAVQ